MEERSFDFAAGEVLLIDKPMHWTSFDVVNKVRYALKKKYGIKRFKVGHAGTLDPLATGLLILCTGKATKTIDTIQGQEKEYTGTIRLGATTPSYDLETEINQEFPTEHIDEEKMNHAVEQLTGTIDQFPPIFSAKKLNGTKAYEKARRGEEFELKSNQVTVREFELTRKELPDVDFRISCSKGTYIRSMAHDFGKLLNSGGHLTALRRTRIGEHKVENAFTVDQIITIINSSS